MPERGKFSLLFVGVIAIPAMVLATAAFRGLAQERARVEQEFGARIRADAAQVAGRLDEAVERLVSGAEEPPLGGVVLEIRDGQVSWRPVEALSYNPGRESTEAGVPAELEKAQLAELRDRRFDEALAGYRKGRGKWPQWCLFLEARLLPKMGRKEEARLAWRSLAQLPEVMLGALPSRFLARFETGDKSLLDDLEAGKWSFSRARFFHYRTALGGEGRDFGPKVMLANAAADFLAEPRAELADGTLAWRRGERAVLLPKKVLVEKVWGRVAREHLRLVEDGKGEGLRHFPANWRVAADDVPAPALAAFDRQQRWVQLLLGLVLLAGGAGGYFLHRAMRREMEMAAMQADFVAAVSHEFRSPLAGIRQLVHLLERERVPDEARKKEYYAMMGRECTRLTRLVENVLDFSRMETGKKEYRMEAVETGALLRELADGFVHEGVRLEMAIADGLPGVRVDREAMGTAVRNLLDNAAKYSGEACTIRLEASTRDSRVAICVRDEGAGIALEHQARIFDRFYRAPGETSRRVKGVGLGLALVKRIVEAHGGTVRVESELGKGSVFTIELEGLA